MVDPWWCNAGEPLWSDERWNLLFLSDDGHMWELGLGHAGDQPGGENLHWDYEALRLLEAPPSDLGPEESQDIHLALKRASPLTRARMNDLQTKILDRVASAAGEQKPWVTAKRLRKALESYGVEAVNRAAIALCPRHMQLREASQGDYFEATFAGLLESQITGRVSALVEATLIELREEYSADPDINMFRWSPIRDALRSDDEEGLRFAGHVYTAMGWRPRGQRDGQEWSFDVPEDVEQIHRCSDLPEYLRYLRKQSLRPWPTCPEAPQSPRAPVTVIVQTPPDANGDSAFSGTLNSTPHQTPALKMEVGEMSKHRRNVFVVHGRNGPVRDAIFGLLRSVDLNPMEWEEARGLTGKASPYIGEILDAAFTNAQAIVVLLTGDDEARLRKELRQPSEPAHEMNLTPQARPNVLFEAGMALASHPDRTLLIEVGALRPFSDLAGRHTVRLDTGGTRERQQIVSRLKDAGCLLVTEGRSDWLDSPFFRNILGLPQTSADSAGTEPELVAVGTPAVPSDLKGKSQSVPAVVELGLDYVKKNISAELHQYELVASVTNSSRKRFDDWEVEIEFPSPLVEPGIIYGSKVNSQSDATRSLFRAGSESHKKPLRPGEKSELRIGYRVDKAIYYDRRELLSQSATVRAFVNGELVAELQRLIEELQVF